MRRTHIPRSGTQEGGMQEEREELGCMGQGVRGASPLKNKNRGYPEDI